MNDFYSKMAEILEVDAVNPGDVLAEFPVWDSLSVLSVIAMLDTDYGINVTAMELRNWRTAGELADAVGSRKSK